MALQKAHRGLAHSAIEGFPDDVINMLHHSIVHIAMMRRSIESVDAHLAQSRKAILEADELLKRLDSLVETTGAMLHWERRRFFERG